jgi:HD-like signal output (HDOD) protein
MILKGKDLFDAIEKSPKFPKIPKELCDIINMLQEPEKANIDEIVERIQVVENLELMILNFINSEFFKAQRKVINLKDAIVFLGMNTMQVIIIAQIVSYLFPRDHHEFSAYHKKIYLKHSIGTAVASITIAEWLGEGNKYELFAYGVLHDIGVVLYEVCLPDTIDKVQEIIIRGNHPVLAERIVFGGIDHTDIGTWFCEKLNFPSNISEVIACHHWPKKSKNRNRNMDILNLGDYISHIYYRDFLIKYYNNHLRKKKVCKSFKFTMVENSLNIPEEVIEEICRSLPDDVEKTLKLFKRF